MTDAFGGHGGIAQYNRDFLSAVAQSGLVHSAIVLPRIAPGAVNSVPNGLVQMNAIKARLAYALRALVAALRTKPTIIFNGHIYHTPLSALLARIVGAKLISQLHGTEIWQPVPSKLRAALEKSDLVLTVSRHTRAQALAQLKIAPEKVVVVNNTVRAAFCPGDREAARRRFGLGGEIALLTVSRLDARHGYKGHDRVIQQLPRLLAKGYRAIYLIAGIGPDHERLADLADGLGVSSHVRFLGKVDDADLPDLYRASDLFALPSTGEGFGIAFLEAMACGTPAIGLAVGGAPDALADGDLGACVSEHQFPEALEDAIRTCGQRPKRLAQEIDRRFGRKSFVNAIAAQIALVLDAGQRAASNTAI
ncbi:glycosyltransferase [Porphyrobacter sp. SLTP]|nr:glycosyltransferase [Porphyrobacter sp. SLTP]